MGSSETFGVESGRGAEVVGWMNEQAGSGGGRLEARLYGRTVSTENFGDFEMFSWMGDAKAARRLLLRASKRFKVRVIEGGYKPRERTFRVGRHDYAMVRRGGRTVGHIEFAAPRIGGQWEVLAEERR